MANPPLGNSFIEGPLGVVKVSYKGVDLGKTTDETTLEIIEDIKDIMYSQNGTQPYDKIPTGQAYQLTCKPGEITWTRLNHLMRGLTVSGTGKSAKAGRDIYSGGRDNHSGELVVTRVDSDGVVSTDQFYKMTFYKAMPQINGALGAFGPDTQRDVEVVFYIFYDETNEAFGYSGYASSLGL